MQVLANL